MVVKILTWSSQLKPKLVEGYLLFDLVSVSQYASFENPIVRTVQNLATQGKPQTKGSEPEWANPQFTTLADFPSNMSL